MRIYYSFAYSQFNLLFFSRKHGADKASSEDEMMKKNKLTTNK